MAIAIQWVSQIVRSKIRERTWQLLATWVPLLRKTHLTHHLWGFFSESWLIIINGDLFPIWLSKLFILPSANTHRLLHTLGSKKTSSFMITEGVEYFQFHWTEGGRIKPPLQITQRWPLSLLQWYTFVSLWIYLDVLISKTEDSNQHCFWFGTPFQVHQLC